MKIKPTQDKILVKRIKPEEKTTGGIIIPENAKEKPSKGEVMAIGDGKRDDKGNLIPVSLKVGQTVLFGKWSGTEIESSDKSESLIVMSESDVIAIIE